MSHHPPIVELRQARYLVPLLTIGVLYLVTRVQRFLHVGAFEDHDSVALLIWSRELVERGLDGLVSMDPDASLLFAVCTALISKLGLGFEAAARMVSLVSALALFAAILLIGRLTGRTAGCLVGLALLALNPSLMMLSAAILTEPLFVATVYWGLLVFLKDAARPALGRAALLGLILGAAFLNRLETLMLVGFFPLLMVVRQSFFPPATMTMRKCAGWVSVFIATFAALAVPQIVRVSHEMGAFALNGRAAWTLLLQSPQVGDAYLEKIRGLYFDPGTVNVVYLKRDFSAAAGLVGSPASGLDLLLGYASTVQSNLFDLPLKLWVMLGPMVIVFALVGLLDIWRSGRRFEAALFASFVGVCLIAPLLHNVVVRHILVIAPIIILLAGIGMQALWESTSSYLARISVRNRRLMLVPAAASIVLLWAPALYAGLLKPEVADRNDRAQLQEVLDAIKSFSKKYGVDQPRIVAARRYLAWHAGIGSSVSAPYTDLRGFVRYCALNHVDLVFVDAELGEYPFLRPLLDDPERYGFLLEYQGSNGLDEPVALYRIDLKK